MSEPLEKACPRIFQCRGSRYEGDICAVLRHTPYFVRAFEFGLADCAVDCTREYDISTSLAERYFDVHQRRHVDSASELLLFDIKSTVKTGAGKQVYVTNVAQQRHVAFYVGITAADPTFVDVIPNYDQLPAALTQEDDTYTKHDPAARINVNPKRTCVLPAGAYGGLDQSNTPYRMPLSLLPEAISRIRQCAITKELVYINPWTGVEFRHWKPMTTRLTKLIRPRDTTDQATAYEAALDLFRIVNHGAPSALRMDFVGLQPSLADFKFLVHGRQWFVQHKIDLSVRATESRLDRVAIAREDGTHFFSTFDRFDFLWQQFRFSRDSGAVEDVVFFIPEKELPEYFYTTTDATVSFEAHPHLRQFQMPLDVGGRWISTVLSTILQYPEPRCLKERPSRTQREPNAAESSDEEAESKLQAPRERKEFGGGAQGRFLYKDQMRRGHYEFFYRVVELCARRMSGLLVVLSANHLWGDYLYCRYRWSTEEKERFLRFATLPKACHHLPANTPVLPIAYYTQHTGTSFHGPLVRPRHYRRWNASAEPRLTVWDLGGPDVAHNMPPTRHAIIPTDDFAPTDAQRAVLERNVAVKKKDNMEERNPSLSAVLKTGLFAAEYGVGPGGPLSYDKNSNVWVDVVDTFDKFLSQDDFEHPRGHVRSPVRYQYELSSVHQRLAEQHRADRETGKHSEQEPDSASDHNLD